MPLPRPGAERGKKVPPRWRFQDGPDPILKVATRTPKGPFSARIVSCWTPPRGCEASVAYEIKVKGSEDSFTVYRSYSSFRELWAGLMSTNPHELANATADLPAMPSKSCFPKACPCFSGKFMKDREAKLCKLVMAAVDADPFLMNPLLQAFLGSPSI